MNYCCLHFNCSECGQSSPKDAEVSASSPALQTKSELRYNYLWFAQHCGCQNLNEKLGLKNTLKKIT